MECINDLLRSNYSVKKKYYLINSFIHNYQYFLVCSGHLPGGSFFPGSGSLPSAQTPSTHSPGGSPSYPTGPQSSYIGGSPITNNSPSALLSSQPGNNGSSQSTYPGGNNGRPGSSTLGGNGISPSGRTTPSYTSTGRTGHSDSSPGTSTGIFKVILDIHALEVYS